MAQRIRKICKIFRYKKYRSFEISRHPPVPLMIGLAPHRLKVDIRIVTDLPMADSVVLRRENLPKLLNYCEKNQKMGKEEKKEEEHEEEEDDGCLNDFTPYPRAYLTEDAIVMKDSDGKGHHYIYSTIPAKEFIQQTRSQRARILGTANEYYKELRKYALVHVCKLWNEHNSIHYSIPDYDEELRLWSSHSGPKYFAIQTMMEFGFTKAQVDRHIQRDIEARSQPRRLRRKQPSANNIDDATNDDRDAAAITSQDKKGANKRQKKRKKK